MGNFVNIYTTFKTKKNVWNLVCTLRHRLYPKKYHKMAKMSPTFLFPTYTNLSPTYFSRTPPPIISKKLLKNTKNVNTNYVITLLLFYIFLGSIFLCLAIINLKVSGFAFGICFPSIWHILEQKSRYCKIISQIQSIKKRVIFHYRFRRFSTNKESFKIDERF